MEITIYFEATEILFDAIKRQAQDLPDDIALLDAGVDEGKITEKTITADYPRLERFIKTNSLGFFLYNRDATVLADVNIADREGYPYIYFYQEDSKCKFLLSHVEPVVNTFAGYGAFFIYACSDKELDSKNRIKLQMGEASVESWVGRSITRYLPGVYWVTWISDKYAAKLNLDIEEIVTVLDIPKKRVAEGYYLKLGNKADSWKGHQGKLETLSDQKGVIFNVKKVIKKVKTSSVKNILELEDVLSEWD